MNSTQILKENMNWAVLGVTTNKEKFGYKVYQKLKELNKNVYGVSPIYHEIDGEHIYPSLTDINQPIDVVVFIVNKKFASEYIAQMKSLDLKLAWMQPGTYDDDLLISFKNHNIDTILDCVLVQANNIK